MGEISILPIDIGFDLRDHDMAVDLRHLEKIKTLRYLNEIGEDCVLRTDESGWIDKLLDAGYTVHTDDRLKLTDEQLHQIVYESIFRKNYK